MTPLHLNSAQAKNADELAGAIIARHGGRAAMSVADLEVVASMVRVFNAMRGAAPADLPQLVGALSRLESMLPSPGKATGTALDRLHQHIAQNHRTDAAGALPEGGRYPSSGKGVERSSDVPTRGSEAS
jgi:hypothetical protein